MNQSNHLIQGMTVSIVIAVVNDIVRVVLLLLGIRIDSGGSVAPVVVVALLFSS